MVTQTPEVGVLICKDKFGYEPKILERPIELFGTLEQCLAGFMQIFYLKNSKRAGDINIEIKSDRISLVFVSEGRRTNVAKIEKPNCLCPILFLEGVAGYVFSEPGMFLPGSWITDTRISYRDVRVTIPTKGN